MKHLPGEAALVMATQAELPFGLNEQRRVIGPVGVVAFRALSGSRMLVACGQLRLLLRVAPETQVRLFGLQLEGADQTVWLVAGRAVSVGQGRVRLANRASDVCVAFEAPIALLEASAALQLGLHRLVAGKAEEHREQDGGEAPQALMGQLPCPPCPDSTSVSWSPES